ncbi:hypothetical protein [Sphingomicrobium lutaoense]|uniref:Uncharacterized protein n=1 Tax=Sphingomicrobium lutaoense TaxID=515949 RepID=A0A839Z3D0_9SPHN|nr:hypothetical protein [Sphingomicrobium lutaoense]MBB3764587.1 hypothetical protein [Sphingomicrobium lutaoense]
MRRLLILLIILVIGAIALVASPFLDVSQTRPATLPKVEADDEKIVAEPGQAPSFEVETGTITIGDAEDGDNEMRSAETAGTAGEERPTAP